MTIPKNIGKLLLVATIASLSIGGIAAAAIPNSDNGQIHGCRSNLGGLLRIIDREAGAACITGETELIWSQVGPRGSDGPIGPQGPQGEPGPRSFLSSTQRFSKKVVVTEPNSQGAYQLNEILTCHEFSSNPMELLSGGYQMGGPGNLPQDFDFQVWRNGPTGHPGWGTIINANYPFSVTLEILCGKGE